MIHNSSSDPVLIKKISLKIWSLRDEIEGRIQTELEKNPDAEINLDNIRNQYLKQTENNNVLELKTGTDLDTSEDEMAKAMRGEEATEDTGGDSENSENSEANESNVIGLGSNSNIIEISLIPPTIAEDKIAKGKTVLAEINMDKMFFFSNKAFTEGQSIVIQFCIPKTFTMNADVLYCRPFNHKSRIISQNNYSHRVLIRFSFLKEGERALLRQFIKSIEPEIQKVEKKANQGNEDDAGFGELDDLGL